jgi:DNA-binding NarL/FixJ family response regulator
VYDFLYRIEKDLGHYEQAMQYLKLYTDYLVEILIDKQKNDLLISESKYNYQQTQNENKRLLIERQYIFLVILFLIIVVISISFYYVWRINKQKTYALELEKASLEAEQQIQALQSMAAGFNDKEQSLRMEALSRFDILKKVALLKEDEQLNAKTGGYKRSPMERINEIIYGSIKGFDWNMFFNSIRNNVLYKNLFDTIDRKDFFKDLDDLGQRICYLICMDFSNPEIATLLGCSLRTVEQRKTNLRKNLDIPTKEDVKKYLVDSSS